MRARSIKSIKSIKSTAWLMSSVLLLGVMFGGTSSVYAEETNDVGVEESALEAAVDEIKVEVSTSQLVHNGSKVQIQTVMYNGRLYAPLRDICRELGCDVEVDLDEKLILLNHENSNKPEPSHFILPADMDMLKWKTNIFHIQVGGIDTFLETLFTNGTNFVPIRYTAELLNKSVTWDADNHSVVLSDNPNDTVGFVNEESVSERYFNYFLKPQLQREAQQVERGALSDEDLDRIKTEMFQNVAVRVMLKQKVKENDVTLSAEDKAAINANVLAGIQNSGGMENYRILLEQNSVYFNETVSVYKETYLINKLINELVMDIEASEIQLLNYYEENQEDYALPEQRRVKHILIPFEDESDEGKVIVKNLAQDILDRVKAGEDFDALMSEFSKDPGLLGAPDGYVFPRGQMVPEFEEAAFSMKPGEVSGLVETVYGYHILKLEEEIPAEQFSFEKVREDIKATLDPKVKEEFWQHTLAKWNEEIVIDFQP